MWSLELIQHWVTELTQTGLHLTQHFWSVLSTPIWTVLLGVISEEWSYKVGVPNKKREVERILV